MQIKLVIFDLDMWRWELNLMAESSLCGSLTQFNFRCVTVDIIMWRCNLLHNYSLINGSSDSHEGETGYMTWELDGTRQQVSERLGVHWAMTSAGVHYCIMTRDRYVTTWSSTCSSFTHRLADGQQTTLLSASCVVCARGLSRVRSCVRDIQLFVADWQYSYTVREN